MITLLTDYGLADEFVGVCHGVIAAICPQALVIDLTHGIPRHDIRAGAVVLADSLRFLPVGVHVAVVDPGVGSRRRAVALGVADGRVLVGPDNGVLSLAAQAGGGVLDAVEISESPLRLSRFRRRSTGVTSSRRSRRTSRRASGSATPARRSTPRRSCGSCSRRRRSRTAG